MQAQVHSEKTKKRSSPLSFLLGGVVIALGLLWLVWRPSPAEIEALYSRGFYPALARVVVPVTNSRTVLARGLLLSSSLPLLWLASLVVSWRRKRTVKQWLLQTLWRTVVGAAAVFLLFVVLWGANYRRASVETQFGLKDVTVTQADLEQLLSYLTSVVQADAAAPRNEQTAVKALVASLKQVVFDTTGVVPTLPARVKRTLPGLLILSGSASGIASPLTLEPHVDGALPTVGRVAIAAHELAHVAGYAGEADADFVSTLAGLRAADGYARYAVALRVWQSVVVQLPSEAQTAAFAQLPEVARQDLAAMVAPFQRYRPPALVQAWQRRTYDRYLKTQGVAAGVRDYSRSVALLAAAQRQGLLPSD